MPKVFFLEVFQFLESACIPPASVPSLHLKTNSLISASITHLYDSDPLQPSYRDFCHHISPTGISQDAILRDMQINCMQSSFLYKARCIFQWLGHRHTWKTIIQATTEWTAEAEPIIFTHISPNLKLAIAIHSCKGSLDISENPVNMCLAKT